MSTSTITQPIIINISKEFTDYFLSVDKSGWINGRPVLVNGDVWCPMCETWHQNNSHCQQ